VAAYISDTTWDWTGGEVALTCRSCGTTKEISAARIRSARSAPVEKRSCNCQRYGQRYRDVAAAVGYEVVESYRGMKIPVCLRHTACGHEWNVAPGNSSAERAARDAPAPGAPVQASTSLLSTSDLLA
jgi:hypothetical protein